ncbi:Uncharacterised protein [Ewingella americana]|uniref:Uncharacterized protein n=1 Tax=Ewingella americana TaxID=41202 RepID=A0A377NID1_9GAMM|nr:Uncharacterised protein [Ewingella americana]
MLNKLSVKAGLIALLVVMTLILLLVSVFGSQRYSPERLLVTAN